MEKLIELLNEYEQENLKVGLLADKWEFDGNLHYYSQYQDELVFTDVDLRIISSRYGFIKWLVKNEKIDLKKLYEKEIESGRDFDGPKTNSEDLSIEFANQYDTEIALMLISIQDKPLEFLVSILKE